MRVLEDRRTIFSSHSPADASIARMVIALLFSSSSFFGVFPFLITLESPRGFLSCHPPSIHSSSFSTDSASLSLYLPWLSGVHPERLSLNQTLVDFSRLPAIMQNGKNGEDCKIYDDIFTSCYFRSLSSINTVYFRW